MVLHWYRKPLISWSKIDLVTICFLSSLLFFAPLYFAQTCIDPLLSHSEFSLLQLVILCMWPP